MILWLRPYYTLDWGRTEMEGTIVISLRIHPTGDTYEIAMQSSSGSEKFDAAAMLAAKSWRFTAARWQGQPIESQVIVALTFRLFEYSAGRIDEAAYTRAEKMNSSAVRSDHAVSIRTLADQLRSNGTSALVLPRHADESPPLRGEMRAWGPVSGVQFLGVIGSPEWRRYKIQSNFRKHAGADSVDVRWELYRVLYEDQAALWEVAIDRKGGAWAMKAESLDATERVPDSAAGCPSAHLSSAR
jgi:TonB family protein